MIEVMTEVTPLYHVTDILSVLHMRVLVPERIQYSRDIIMQLGKDLLPTYPLRAMNQARRSLFSLYPDLARVELPREVTSEWILALEQHFGAYMHIGFVEKEFTVYIYHQ